MKVANPADLTLLNNAIWYALSTDQSYLAEGNHLAKRFPPDISPFGAIEAQSPAAYEALAKLLHGDTVALCLDSQPVLPADWTTRLSLDVYQMTFEGPPPAKQNKVIRKLTQADVPEMLDLTKLTDPGPFLPRTIDLGAITAFTTPDRWWPWQGSASTSPASLKSAPSAPIPPFVAEATETPSCPQSFPES